MGTKGSINTCYNISFNLLAHIGVIVNLYLIQRHAFLENYAYSADFDERFGNS